MVLFKATKGSGKRSSEPHATQLNAVLDNVSGGEYYTEKGQCFH